MTITESKLDSSFTATQYLIGGYSKPFRFDINRNAVGVILYEREDIACRELKSDKLPNDIDGIFDKLNLRKGKWLLFSNCLDAFSSTYDRFLLVGNFNAEDYKETLFSFLEKNNAANIVKDKTCIKSLDNPNCIDLLITNRTRPPFPQTYQIFIKWMLLP